MTRKYLRHQDLTGKTFGYWTVIKLDHTEQLYFNGKKNGLRYYYLCHCKCGVEKIVIAQSLLKGTSKSCGCYSFSDEVNAKRAETHKTHGYSRTRLYKIWIGIKVRCYGNPNRKNYNLYGGRGIKMCDEWINDFMLFREWALTHGYDENAERGECTIDRINVNGDYAPDNCRFITLQEQCNNRRKTTFITYKGETKPMADWCRQYGLRVNTAHKRIKMGWDLDKVFNEPIHQECVRNGKRKKKE